MRHSRTLLCILAVLVAPMPSLAQDNHHGHGAQGSQEGHYGLGHGTWHQSFYSKLIRKDTKTSCCDMTDCRPTVSRMVGDHYEVKVDGVWMPVPKDTIQNVSAPDGGAHVCAPKQTGTYKGTIYCVVLPPET